jgi:serine/threonine-protein kinase
MARRVLRLAYWVGVATVATTVATLVIAFSVGAGPVIFGNDDVTRYLADNDHVAGSTSRPASPGNGGDGAGHAGGTSGAAGGVTGGTAPGQGATGVNDPGVTAGTAPAGGPAPAPTAPGTPTQGPAGGGGPPPTTPATTSGTSSLLFSTGGSVVASCAGTTATLQTWTPKPGYQADDVSAGPAIQVSVKFKSDTASSYLVTVTCSQGTPTLSEQVLSGHGGPGKGGGGSS